MRLIIGVIVGLSVACDGAARPEDAGPLEVPDANLADAGSADAGSDGGAVPSGRCGSVRADPRYWPPLPETCLPRCRAEARDAYFACTTAECVAAVLSGDTTPPAVVDTVHGDLTVACYPEMGMPCVAWQAISCAAEHCPDEYLAWVECTGARPDCRAEGDALDACRAASPEARACDTERRGACFES